MSIHLSGNCVRGTQSGLKTVLDIMTLTGMRRTDMRIVQHQRMGKLMGLPRSPIANTLKGLVVLVKKGSEIR